MKLRNRINNVLLTPHFNSNQRQFLRGSNSQLKCATQNILICLLEIYTRLYTHQPTSYNSSRMLYVTLYALACINTAVCEK